MTDYGIADWFQLAQHELFLFAAVFFLIGALDEIAVDLIYGYCRLTGTARTPRISSNQMAGVALEGKAAIFIPVWREAAVIAPTLRHALAVWPDSGVRIYVGCYRNDAETLASAMLGARGDSRVRLVMHDQLGPTSKADNLNRLYRALQMDEARSGEAARMIVLHDAEDMVDPLALKAMQRSLFSADFVQLPVLALPQRGSRWIAGHYSDEFAEAHGKAMVVRDALGAALPGAGVGCAISRRMLDKLAGEADGAPFAAQSLTEDYELGLRVKQLGGSARFLRLRTSAGMLIATRSFFPADIGSAVRQKTRWVHGIALQSWDRLGWSGGIADTWMQMRDRRGPFAAILLGVAYLLIVLAGVQFALVQAEVLRPLVLSPMLKFLLIANFAALLWRAVMRGLFTAREFGFAEGLRAVPRVFISNIIAIMAGRRALGAYIRTLSGAPVIWDKTEHRDHPVMAASQEVPA